jgi:hypothetical protein
MRIQRRRGFKPRRRFLQYFDKKSCFETIGTAFFMRKTAFIAAYV